MHKSVRWVLVLLMCVPISAAGPNSNVPVVVSIEDTEAAIAPSLQIRSDGSGVYTNSSVLESIIQSGGDWELNTNVRGATRRINLDFSQPIAGSGPNGSAPLPLPTGNYQARFIAKCHLYGNDMLALTAGQTVDCPLMTSFTIGEAGYHIQMNPRTGAAVYPLTDFVSITCTGTGADTLCNQWKVEPSGTFPAPDGTWKKRNRAHFYKAVTSKGKTIETHLGDFYFSFQIQMTKQ
jgi:hypothetical protein